MRTDEVERCPKFDGCSVPLCPLHGAMDHLRGEPICPFMLEAVKPGGDQRLKSILPLELAEAIIEFIPEAMESSRDIARRLRRAAEQGSKVESGRKLAALKKGIREEASDARTAT